MTESKKFTERLRAAAEDPEGNGLEMLLCLAADRIESLEAEALRFYRADGSYETLATPIEVVMRRVGAAVEIARLRAKLGALRPRGEAGIGEIRDLTGVGVPPEELVEMCKEIDVNVFMTPDSLGLIVGEIDRLKAELARASEERGKLIAAALWFESGQHYDQVGRLRDAWCWSIGDNCGDRWTRDQAVAEVCDLAGIPVPPVEGGVN